MVKGVMVVVVALAGTASADKKPSRAQVEEAVFSSIVPRAAVAMPVEQKPAERRTVAQEALDVSTPQSRIAAIQTVIRLLRARRQARTTSMVETEIRMALEAASPPDFDRARTLIFDLPAAKGVQWGMVLRSLLEQGKPGNLRKLWAQSCKDTKGSRRLRRALRHARKYLIERHQLAVPACSGK